MRPHAYIAGVSGLSLTDDEKRLFAATPPWAFILFARNIESRQQVRALCEELRASVPFHFDAPILIDQEGGRVQRLKPPLSPKHPPADVFAQLYAQNPEHGERAVMLNSLLIAHDLRDLGITIDCLPVLDLRLPETHDIIGDRSYGAEPATVIALARAAAIGLMAQGVMPVLKHIPGHGRATADSHEELPVVTASRMALEQDFIPFKALRAFPLAMTAHVVYTALDAHAPATTSRSIIREIIRQHMRFDGLLMSDDLSMKALKGDFETRTRQALAAGCDVALHCNGDMAEMLDVAQAAPLLKGKALSRAVNVQKLLAQPVAVLDKAKVEKELNTLLKPVGANIEFIAS